MEELLSAVAAPPLSTLEHSPIPDSSATGLTRHIRAARSGPEGTSLLIYLLRLIRIPLALGPHHEP
jgi:hypothetical protein